MVRLDRPLVLTGMPGAGKSTVGVLLADKLGVPFVDLDVAVAEAAGEPVAALWANRGEAAFRDAEKRAFSGILDAGEPLVVAAGGGTLADPASRRAALEGAFVVHLVAAPAVLEARLGQAASSRPLLAGARAGGSLAGALESLLAARAAGYAECHAAISTDARDPSAVAGAVLRTIGASVWVPLERRGYAVRVTGDAGLALAEWIDVQTPTAVILVTDQTVGKLWAPRISRRLRENVKVPVSVVEIPAGEAHKSLATVERVLSGLHQAEADRSSMVIALGGGLVSDVAGLAASLWMRGIRWTAVPTTLLSMVDAAIGGKTAVDFGGAKNVIGTFHQPGAVFISPGFVTTESARGVASGLAEAVKTALVADPRLLELLRGRADEVLAQELDPVREVIERCVRAKSRIVAADEEDRFGQRAVLNFGHTIGHAVEAYGRFDRFTHGEAVAIGMVAMLDVGVALGVTQPALRDQVQALLGAFRLPTSLPPHEWVDALAGMTSDKKRRGGSVQVVLVRTVGDTELRYVPIGEIVRLVTTQAAARAASKPR